MPMIKKRSNCAKSDYSNTEVKVRDSITNISYRQLKEGDYKNNSVVLDFYSFFMQNFYPFSLQRKFESTTDLLCYAMKNGLIKKNQLKKEQFLEMLQDFQNNQQIIRIGAVLLMNLNKKLFMENFILLLQKDSS